MKPPRAPRIAWVLLLGAAFAEGVAAQFTGPPVPADHVRQASPITGLSGFVENRGQWPEEVLFFARAGGIGATLLADALVFRPLPVLRDPELEQLSGPREAECLLPPLVLWLPDSDGSTSVEGVEAFPMRHNFIVAAGSASNVFGFASVMYRDVLSGIDLQVRIENGRFEYDVRAAPGADVSRLVLTVEGAECMEVVGGDTLAMHTPAGVVEQRIGASWQVDPADGDRESLASRFRMLESPHGRAMFGFEAPGWDPKRALVIDPSLVYATYVGGSTQELFRDMTVDGAGAVYLTCRSFQGTPTTPGAFQTAPPGTYDAWVGKLAPSGATLEWGTYFGGTDVEDPVQIGVHVDGSVVVAGTTWSSDLPTTQGSLQPISGGGGKSDVFVAKLDPTGTSLVWSTYYGSSNHDVASAMAILPSGDVLVAADPSIASPPATPGAFDTTFNSDDQMVFRVSGDGSSLVFQTYFKCSDIYDIAVDATSNAYFCGVVLAAAAPLPTTPGAFKEALAPGDSGDGFVAKMDPMGAQISWATYLGGNEGLDLALAVAVDATSTVYVTGHTDSIDFPVSLGAFDPQLSGSDDGFVARLLPNGSNLVWSTYFGGSCCQGTSGLIDIVVDLAGNVVAVGSSNESVFPTTADAFQLFYVGPFPAGDVHLTKFDAFGEGLVYSTWFGGNSSDGGPLVGLDTNGQLRMAMMSTSTDIPVTSGAYQPVKGGNEDLVVAEFDLPLLPWRVLAGGLTGTKDTPNLAGAGMLVGGMPTRLSVRGAAVNAPTWGVVGFSELNLPLLGGTLVPWPDLVFPFTTDAGGALDVAFRWPAGFTPGKTIIFQFWVLDPGALFGFSATNGIKALP